MAVAQDNADFAFGEREIENQAERQLILFKKAPGFIAVLHGPDHVFEFVNDAYVRLVGERDYLGRAVLEIMPELKGQGLIEVLDQVYLTGQRYVASARELRLGDSASPENRKVVLDFIYEPIRDAGGQVTGIFIEGHDVTEAHVTKVALQKSEAQLRALVNASNNVIYRMSPDWRQMLRLDGAEFIATTESPTDDWLEGYIPPADQQRVRDAIQDAITTKSPFELEHRVYRADGSIGWTFSRAVPLLNEEGDITEWFGQASDVSARVKADQSFARMFAASPAPFLVLAPDAPRFTIMEVNDAYLAATYRTREAVIGHGVFDAFPDNPDDSAVSGVRDLRASLERVLATRRPDTLPDLRYDVALPDGTFEERYWSPVNSAVLDDDGQVEAIIHNANDVTEQRRIEASLRESEAHLKLALEAGRLAEVTFLLPDGILHSPAFASLLGYPSNKQMTLLELRSRYHPDDLGRVVTGREAFLTSDRMFYEIEHRIVWPDGQIRWVRGRGRVQRDNNGQAVAVTAVYLDETDRKNAEVALRESEARLRAVINAAPIGLVFADASGKIEGNNARVEEIVGMPIVRSKNIDAYSSDYVAFHADGRQVESNEYPLARVLQDNCDRAELEVQAQLPGGKRRWVRYIATPVRNENGDLLGGVVASLDIERDKRFAESLSKEVARAVKELDVAQAALRQSQKMEAMGTLTGGVAHDFNNLLTPILGGLDMLQRRGVGDERAQRMIAGALQSAERAKTLVQRLLAFARRQPLQSTSVDIGALVKGMAELIASTTGPQVAVAVNITSDAPFALADANQVEMALLNLAVNARDAMPDGGSLTIKVSDEIVEGSHKANLSLGSYVRLSVSDTGAGMDAATLKRAVEPFYSTKGIGKGTGLGLSMVHGLAAQLGGGMHIESDLGNGTTIEIWFPLADTDGNAAQIEAGKPVTKKTGVALLIDDEDLVRASTADMLIDIGYEVIEADCARDALRLLDDGIIPDIVVTDHLMADMTGTELAELLHKSLPHVPVLIISGYSEVKGLPPGLARLTKPFRTIDLATAISSLKSHGQ